MLKVLELFAGIGACSKALERLGIEHEIVDAVEIDKYAITSFNAIHGTNFEVQDITTWDKDIKVDLIMHGSPCQDISVAGKQEGADEGSGTRSSLMYETLRIVNKLKPKYVIWENVKNLISKKHKHNFDNYVDIMSEGGYNSYYQVLNAKDYGIPQNRERVFTISIRKDIDSEYNFPNKETLEKNLQELLESNVEEKYFLSEKGIKYVLKRVGGYVQLIDNNTEIAHCPITAKGNTNWTGNFVKFEFPPKEELKLRLKDMLENEVDEKYFLKDVQIERIKATTYSSGTWKSRVQEEISSTLCARDYKDPKCIQVGNLKRQGYHEFSNRVYSEEGIARTLMSTGGENSDKTGLYHVANLKGGVSQTLQCNDSMGVVVEKQRKDIKEIEKYCEYCGKQLQRKRFNGRLEDFTVFSNRKYCNRECMKRAYLKIGEYSQNWSNAHTTARKINELILHKELCELCGSDTNLDIHHIDGNWQNNNLDNLMCLCRSCHTKYEKNKNNEDSDFRIRKLTPRETWRLMGFDDEDFEKAKKSLNETFYKGKDKSTSQLYKQARKFNRCKRS